jgi:hypothetical protein
MNETEALLKLEERRCAAIGSADGPALRDTLSDDYMHVHALGYIDDREGFIAGALSNPRIVERGSIAVRFYGDVAILIGEQINRRGDTVMAGVMQQIAAKRDGAWRFVSAQMTRKE